MVELIVITAIISVLALLALPAYSHFKTKAKVAGCTADLRTLEKEVMAYIIDKGSLPSSLNNVGRGDFKDPWGRPYNYKRLSDVGAVPYEDFAATPLNTDFDLYSSGPDGMSTESLTLGNPTCEDDVIRAADGGYVGRAGDY